MSIQKATINMGKNEEEEKKQVVLTPEQALSLLSDDEEIHTFRSLPNTLIGADWTRDELVTEINRCKCEIGGPACRQLEHGLVIWTGKNNPLFVKVKAEVLEAFEKTLKEAGI